MKGYVKFFNKEKGFGFIRANDGNEYFAHASEIKDQAPDVDGKKHLGAGWNVSFELKHSHEKGPMATNIKILL